MQEIADYHIRIVTAASLFDGHDAAINIMRRILQSKGAEIIHLGHNRSVHEIVEAAIEEDAHAIAVTSYQGGHLEFFKYMKDLLDECGCGHIKIFGGGGGTILPQEIEELHNYGITRIYSPDDGRRMGLEGMIEDCLSQTLSGGEGFKKQVEYHPGSNNVLGKAKNVLKIARAITNAEKGLYKQKQPVYDGSSITVTQFKADPFLYKRLKEFSARLRYNSTMAEQVLWDKLRNKKEGYKFRRQHIIAYFIADFVCLKKGLVVELDGNHHQLPEMKISDAQRTQVLNEMGFAVLRFSNDDVLYNISKVTETIHNKLQQLPDKQLDEDVVIEEQSQLPTSSPTGGSRKGAVLGITGTGGAGKSSVTDEIVRRYLNTYTDKTIAVISVDPSRKKTGGALLGDRIRMNAISHPRTYMRSMATRSEDASLSDAVQDAIDICQEAGFDLVILESAGVGQSDASILDHCDTSIYVMTPEYGAATQLEKINMLDYADIICINKFDKAGALDALQDVRKQYKRNHGLWNANNEDLPVIGTVAAQFNDEGMNRLFEVLAFPAPSKPPPVGEAYDKHSSNIVNNNLRENGISKTSEKNTSKVSPTGGGLEGAGGLAAGSPIIPPKRTRYLAEIAENNRAYDEWVKEQSAIASKLYQLKGAAALLQQDDLGSSLMEELESRLDKNNQQLIANWPLLQQKYAADFFEYTVRNKTIQQPLTTTTLSGTRVPKVVLPKYKDWGDILQWQLQENLPGEFPYTAGVFELKRQGEDPTRMFAGEGGPERTNKRFHYLSAGQPAKRLSTAFDSVTLYGEDPGTRPDIYGKIGNSGVSVATLDDMKKLFEGFDLCDANTSVSMTINGPAPIILAMFFNTVAPPKSPPVEGTSEVFSLNSTGTQLREEQNNRGFEQNVSKVSPTGGGLEGAGGTQVGIVLSLLRGTVQSDILKEDQAQNTCIFSTEFALKLMGDVQEYFIQHNIRNFYSVSISGYHIAEAGANPITQLAFTLSNGFTYVEYYLSRGMHIDEFAPNLSFFFSNGMDAEYSVIGRVARRIWAKAMKVKYKANERSQKLKYHIQTSGRSLHAQEIDFNDIRTTLQALYAIYDNCNSLHTNAYDEAITTPTEESVRRAMAIQLIINRELGSAKTENFIQGSFIIEELTDLVEEAVLQEFERINARGGVLGAMERMYQRNKIQEESLLYEGLKHTGELPIVGVNTFLNPKGSPTVIPAEVIRSTTAEKDAQIENLNAFKETNKDNSNEALQRLKQVAVNNGNIFAELMETVKYCSLGQITHALYEVGGQYRRNM